LMLGVSPVVTKEKMEAMLYKLSDFFKYWS